MLDIYQNIDQEKLTNDDRKSVFESKPVYAALSLNNLQLKSFKNRFVPELLKWLERKNIPLFLL